MLVAIDLKTRELLAEQILNDFKDAITGNGIERIVNENPEDKFYVGKLISINDDDDSTFFNSKTFIESIGVDFYIPVENIDKAKLRLFPQGDFYYRVYPTLDEQRKAFLENINKSSEKKYDNFEDFICEAAADQSLTEIYKTSVIPVYKKIQLHKDAKFLEISLSQILDLESGYGFVDKLHPVNKELDDYLLSLQEEIEADEENYKYDIKQDTVLADLIDQASWEKFIDENAKKQVRIFQRWAVYFDISMKQVQNQYLVSVTLINDSQIAISSIRGNKRNRITIETLFNSGIQIQLINTEFIPIELEYFIDDYKYDRTQKAIGTNCSIIEIDEDTVVSDNLPTYRQYRLVTNDALSVSFSSLIKDPVVELQRIETVMQKELILWEKYYNEVAEKLTSTGKERLEQEILAFKSEISRFKFGVEIISNYPEIKKSFVYMNRTFQNASQKYKTWRLFQIVFIVSIIPDIAACDSALLSQQEKRNTFIDQVDLLFFPTGGGKTEAFLGAVVFNLFFDRMRGKACGVTAILRYPLRLLSVQQVQRLANILAQAELIRRQDNYIKDTDAFSLGYFVGESNTPNRLEFADIKKFNNMTQKTKDELRIMDVCPFCGQQTVHLKVDETQLRLIHYCDDGNCPSGGILPIYIVDREIYRYLPSAIISTVDKLAVVGYNRNFRNIVNGASRRCPVHGYTSLCECIEKDVCKIEVSEFISKEMYDPTPTLFIQDELHLIRESLGTYASHYESFIDYYARELSNSRRNVKVVGATATISTYELQIWHLYKKTPIRFPSASPFVDRNVYAYIDKNDLQRLILGYAPYGKAIINSVAYSLKYMRQIVHGYYTEPQRILDIPGIAISTVEEALEIIADYWIMLEYNNVKRDSNNVEGALETPINIELLAEGVTPFNVRKMTGDETFQDVREVLAEVENTDNVFSEHGVNLIAATSMISHGVDADRFNIMFFFGIPGNTAEYIQAYSRTGRRHSSIVVDIMRPTRETDQSYLKNFIKFHEYKDIMVEAVPINRWATKAIDSTLPGVFAGLILSYYDIALQYTYGSLYNMKNLKNAINRGALNADEIKEQLYNSYGCTDGTVANDIGNQYRVKIDKFVDDFFGNIVDRNWTRRDFMLDGFELMGYKIMRSLRDTDTQLIIELE